MIRISALCGMCHQLELHTQMWFRFKAIAPIGIGWSCPAEAPAHWRNRQEWVPKMAKTSWILVQQKWSSLRSGRRFWPSQAGRLTKFWKWKAIRGIAEWRSWAPRRRWGGGPTKWRVLLSQRRILLISWVKVNQWYKKFLRYKLYQNKIQKRVDIYIGYPDIELAKEFCW